MVIGSQEGDYLCWYEASDGLHYLLTRTKTIPVPQESKPCLCQNGKEYAWVSHSALFVNGLQTETIKNTIRELTFSPDGSRLLYGVQNYTTITIHDVFSPQSDIQIPANNIEQYSFSFGNDQILQFHYYSGNYNGVREEDSFLPDEDGSTNQERLLETRSLFFHRKDGGFFLRGTQIKTAGTILDYTISRDYTKLTTLSATVIAEKYDRPLSKKISSINLKIATNGHTLIQEQATLSELFPEQYQDTDITAGKLRDAGLYYHIGFTDGGLPLNQLSLPDKNDRTKIGQTQFRAGKRNIPGIYHFQTTESNSACCTDTAVLTDINNKEYLMADGQPEKDSFDLIRAVTIADSGSIFFIADKNGQTAVYTTLKNHHTGKKESIKNADAITASLTEQRDLRIREIASDRDGIYAATNRGVFLSFNGGKSWTQYPGYSIPTDKKKKPQIQRMLSDGINRYAVTEQNLWYSNKTMPEWTPIAYINNPARFEFYDKNLIISDGDTGRHLRVFNGKKLIRDEHLSRNDMTDGNTRLLNHADTGSDPRLQDETIRATAGNTILIGTRSGLLLSADKGNSWTRLCSANGLTGDNITGAVIRRNRIAVLTAGTLLCYNDAGAVSFWYEDIPGCTTFYPAPSLHWCPSALDALPEYTDPHLKIARGEKEKDPPGGIFNQYVREKGCYSGISLSDDNGYTWHAIRTEQLPGAPAANSLKYISAAGSTLFIFGNSLHFYSDDWGKTWHQMELPAKITPEDIISVQDFENDLYLSANTANGLYRYTKNNWTPLHEVFSSQYAGRNCTGISSDKKYIYAETTGITGQTTILKFNKKTQSWTNAYFRW
jgi:photosystem II stability/assembly factor-like uncharacterized protein